MKNDFAVVINAALSNEVSHVEVACELLVLLIRKPKT